MAKISNVFSKEEVKKSVHPKRITKWIHYTKLVSCTYIIYYLPLCKKGISRCTSS